MTRRLKKGGYTAALSLVAAAAVVLFNMTVQKLPESARKWDLSGEKLYTLSDTTKELLAGLTRDVTIYIVTDPTLTDERITELVERYEEASPWVHAETIDSVLHPDQVTGMGAENNSLLINCEETGKKETIPFEEIIVYDQMAYLYYQQLVETEFDGEGQITSAIARVTSDVEKKAYRTEGHGEEGLSQSVTDLLEKSGIEEDTVNILTDSGIPEDCDLLIINNPLADLADDEKDSILDYLNSGGHVMILAGYTGTDMPNLEEVMGEYGIRMEKGLVADTERYYQNDLFCIFPEYGTSEIVSGMDSSLAVLVMQSGALAEKAEKSENVETDTFLMTSENGVLVTEEGQSESDSYALAMTGVKTLEDGEGKLTVIAAPSLISEYITGSFTNLANLEVFMNAVTWNFDDVTNISIPAKSLQEPYNSIVNGAMWAMLFIFVIPAAVLITGFAVWTHRRKL